MPDCQRSEPLTPKLLRIPMLEDSSAHAELLKGALQKGTRSSSGNAWRLNRGFWRNWSEILMNPATNARDALPDGGSLRIATRNPTRPPDKKDAATFSSGRRDALVAVADTGSGMDEDIKTCLFEPFFTTTKAFGAGRGAGLALATVYGIVKQSDGHIELDARSQEKRVLGSTGLPAADREQGWASRGFRAFVHRLYL